MAVVGGGGGGGRVGARTENSLLLSSFSVILESLCSRVRSKSERRKGCVFLRQKMPRFFSLIRWGFLHMCLRLKRCERGGFHFSFVEAKLSGREKIAETFGAKRETEYKIMYCYQENHSSRKIGVE